MSELPNGWSKVSSGDLCDFITSGSRDWKEYYSSTGALFVRTQDINKDKLELSDVARVDLPKNVEGKRSLLLPSDVLVTITGANVGRVAIVPKEIPEAYVSQSVGLMRLKEPRLAEYLHFYFQASSAGRGHIHEMAYGMGRPVLSLENLRDIPVLLPPLPEQKRIVAKIEELFSELEAGEESLRLARRQLGVYRQSLLKQAFEGKLTAIWRTQNPDKLESAESLLSPSRGKAPQIEALPGSWAACCLMDFVSIERGRFSVRPRNDPRYYGGDIPFVQIGDLPRDGGTISAYKQTLNKAGLGVSKLFRKGTPLIAIVGATIGNTGVLGFDSCCPDSLVAFVSDKPTVCEFVELYFRAHKNRIRSDSYSSGGQPNINNAYLERQVIGVPSLPEQQEIVRLLDAQFEVIERNEREIDAALRKSEALRQAILKKAFTGRLVPQDPSDEPASQLLDRLRATRTIHHRHSP